MCGIFLALLGIPIDNINFQFNFYSLMTNSVFGQKTIH
jgi:hypothetical protein